MRNLLAFILSLYAFRMVSLVQCLNWDIPKLDNFPLATHKTLKTRGKFPLTPSDVLPVNLIEDPDKSLDPTEADLDPEKLRALINGKFDPTFVSITEPEDTEENRNGILSFGFHQGRPTGMRPRFLDTFDQLNIKDANGERITNLDLKLRKSARRRVMRYLWNYTKCPVIYKWKDLGVRFWPRWVREGTCHQSGRSCSFPPGMHCKQSKKREIPILRFYCPRNGTPCRWLNLGYPVIAECSCSC